MLFKWDLKSDSKYSPVSFTAIGRIRFLYNVRMAVTPPKTAKAPTAITPTGVDPNVMQAAPNPIGPNARMATTPINTHQPCPIQALIFFVITAETSYASANDFP